MKMQKLNKRQAYWALTENLMANEILKKLWTHLTVDFITKLLIVAEKDAILVVCNRLLKISRKEVILGYNKDYAILALNCILKNSKGILSASGINKKYRNNNIDND